MQLVPAVILGFLTRILGTVGPVLLLLGRQAASTIGLALALITIFLLLRILFMLAKAYLTVIFLLVFGPLIIALSALTDVTAGIKSWLKNIIANILVFPVTGLVIAFGGILIDRIESASNLWAPPFLGGDTRFLAGVLGLGILLILPEVGNSIQSVMAGKAPAFPEIGVSPTVQRGWQSFLGKRPVRTAMRVARQRAASPGASGEQAPTQI